MLVLLVVFGYKISISVLNAICVNAVNNHKLNFIPCSFIGAKAEILEPDISKCGQIKPKYSWRKLGLYLS